MSHVVKTFKQSVSLPGGKVLDQWCENFPEQCCLEEYTDCPAFPRRIFVVMSDFEKLVNICYTNVDNPITRFFNPQVPQLGGCDPVLDGEHSRIGDIATLCYNGFDNGTYRLHKTWEGEYDTDPGVKRAWYMLSDSVPVGIPGRISASCARRLYHDDPDNPPATDEQYFGFVKGPHPGVYSCMTIPTTPENVVSGDCVCRPTPAACNTIAVQVSPEQGPSRFVCNPCLYPIECCEWFGFAAPAKCDVNVPCDIEWMSVPLPFGTSMYEEGWPLFAQRIVFERFYAAVVDAWNNRTWPDDPNVNPPPCTLGNPACYAGIYIHIDNSFVQEIITTPPSSNGVADTQISYYPVEIFQPRSYIQICIKLKCDEPPGEPKRLVFDGLTFRSIVEGGWSATFSHMYKTEIHTYDFPGDPTYITDITENTNNWSVQGVPSGYVCNNFFTLAGSTFYGPCTQLDIDDPDVDFSDLYKKVVCSFGGSYVGTVEFIGEP